MKYNANNIELPNISSTVYNFTSLTDPSHRYASFDYCYNYFCKTNDPTADMEKSCFVLGFYLASWGMFRGSSFLLQKSAKHFQPMIEYIAEKSTDRSHWKLDVDNYTDDTIQRILDLYSETRSCLGIPNRNAHLTLVTKTLLGVFGCTPAFDQYFCNSFRAIFAHENCRFRSVNKRSLKLIRTFYDHNRDEIDKLAKETITKDFLTGQETQIPYSKAKIIDMYGFNLNKLY